jgi:hypothetical protein
VSFSIDVAKWAAEAGEDVADANEAIIMELFASVILDTPVLDTAEEPDPDGGSTVAKAQEVVLNLRPDHDINIFLTNNLPYAHRIEYDGWSHTKAPAGMVRKNIQRIANIIES